MPTVDEAAAELLLQALEATHLLGARTLLVGIRPALAETLIHIGADLHTIETAATLQDGLLRALNLIGRRVVTVARPTPPVA
ncbi:MAG: hypothetical protein HC876_09205 [Chloroflexaceae bacterium]|nr:hypothetical protein [Chloroflexaceae bacterium]